MQALFLYIIMYVHNMFLSLHNSLIKPKYVNVTLQYTKDSMGEFNVYLCGSRGFNIFVHSLTLVC